MRRSATSLLALILAANLAAQAKLAITFPEVGKYRVWVAAEFPPAPYAPHEVESDTFTLDVPKAIGGEEVFVWDLKTGNVASKSVKAPSPAWKMSKGDFDRVAKTILRVEHAGKPVSSATVKVTDKSPRPQQLLDPTAKGEVEFFGLRHGELKVEVEYRTASGMASPLRQSFELLAERSQPEPVFVVSIAEAVATLDPPKDSQPAAPAAGKSGFLAYLVAIAIAGVVGFLAFMWMRSNQDAVKAKLQSMGVTVPEPADDAPDDVDEDPVPPTPAPQQTIVLSAPAPQSKTGVARLVEEDGSEFNLAQPKITVGRDAGVDLIITNETTVSRKHAELEVSGSITTLRDLGSTNGTFVNGVRLSDSVILRAGDEIRFGKAVFRYEE